MCRVNVTWKTNTNGKLSKLFNKYNKKVVIGAADTFRAAAIDQLKVWCDKNNTEMIQSEVGADTASVAFKTLEYAKNNNKELYIIDNIGRLQNKKTLIEQSAKDVWNVKKIAHDAHQKRCKVTFNT